MRGKRGYVWLVGSGRYTLCGPAALVLLLPERLGYRGFDGEQPATQITVASSAGAIPWPRI